MKPFNLEAAKRGEPIQTRDGREAKFVAHVPEAIESQRIVVMLSGSLFTMFETGLCSSSGVEYADDLFMAPKKRTVWVNLYEYTKASNRFDAYAYVSEALADHARSKDRIGGKAWPLEIED